MAKNSFVAEVTFNFEQVFVCRDSNTLQIMLNLLNIASLIFQGYRFAVLTIGAPAAGINAAVGAFARSAIYQGHTVLGVKDGMKGLVENQVIIFFYVEVSW